MAGLSSCAHPSAQTQVNTSEVATQIQRVFRGRRARQSTQQVLSDAAELRELELDLATAELALAEQNANAEKRSRARSLTLGTPAQEAEAAARCARARPLHVQGASRGGGAARHPTGPVI